MEQLVAPLINVTILVGMLVYFLRAPLREFVSSRHSSVRDELQRVADQLRQSQAQYDEFSAKLKAMQAEIGQLRDQARQDGDAIKLRMITDSKRVAQSIVGHARAAADSVLEDLKTEVMRELSARVLVRAESIIHERLTEQERKRLRSDFNCELAKPTSLDSGTIGGAR